MTDKEKYKQLCETEGSNIPLFLQYWWMNEVCRGKEWNVVLTYDKRGEEIIGAWPFLIGKKLGFRYILQPQLTQYSGPWIRPCKNDCERSRNNWEMKVMDALVKELEKLKVAYIEQCMAPTITNWMPMYWRGYSQTTRYTYRFEDLSDCEQIFKGFDQTKRRATIKRCLKTAHAVTGLCVKDFANMHHRYWSAKGEKDITPMDLMIRVMNKAIKRGNGALIGLENEEGMLLGAHFIVYDENSAYFLLGALNPDIHAVGVSETLVWEELKWFSDKTKAYDFEGSMERGVEYFNRLFGAHPTPYFKITKCNSRLFGWLLKLKR